LEATEDDGSKRGRREGGELEISEKSLDRTKSIKIEVTDC